MNTVRRLHKSTAASKWVRILWWPRFERWQDLEKGTRERKDEDTAIQNYYRLSDDYYISPEKREDALPVKQFEDQTRKDQNAPSLKTLTDHTTLRYVDHSYDNIRRVKRYEALQIRQYDQRFIAERLLFLGPDLAAAHFLVHRDIAIKFVGDDNWYKRSKWGTYSLPGRQVPGLYIEAIDASGSKLMYEGFENLYDLKHLRMLRLANCEYIDDWALSRVGGVCGSTLEFLDLSGCKNITHKGLAALRTARNLKHLRLDGLDHVDQLGKTVLMLEEMIPGLSVSGVNYEKELERLEWENRLKSDDRAVIDAKGNVFIEDDNGELFYVKGKISEKATVNDDDQPIATSTIRRQVPEMSEVEFERLDQLSQGRLRHLLIGSPSGYMWSDQVETILQHEHKLNLKDGVETDPKMLPKEERRKRLLSYGVDIDMLLEEEKKHLLINDTEERTKEAQAH
ncbi:unnamed protein product [Bursaphelenchus okinawaensis]|uniref:ATP synthase subunit s-like protein n=1 Tax=Bursaphelenchus okinawaensis TaxID=465554 RepID=A0A811LAP4_9BILA|nr:unnamed protein product [Bursaphelenchus okinawaensis]CAG9119760.1 unnamed protein product [Bursaphelenchus okinawaensis]